MDQDRTATEMTAGLLLVALDAVAPTDTALAHHAERHTTRLRFALARVDELRGHTDAYGGVFEAARLEVARGILAVHCERATAFVARALGEGAARRPRTANPQLPLEIETEVAADAPQARAA